MASGDLNPWIRALGGEVDRLTRISKMALDAGVEERRTQLAEFVVERMAAVIRAVVDELDLTPDQQARLKVAMARHLSLLNGLDERPRELVA